MFDYWQPRLFIQLRQTKGKFVARLLRFLNDRRMLATAPWRRWNAL